MRNAPTFAACMVAAVTFFAFGCKSSGRANGEAKPAPIITASTNVVGKVASVNPQLRYVVVEFPPGSTLPSVEQRMNVYRGALKVGELKITGPSRNNNTAGDITAGEAATGDVVRVD
ncbi:MAG TPA: hypothetical protein VEH27_04890 [Methylomirabilota bacterium]|nr:hypothetical protein [Methylomirabilota bacterium]